MEGTGSRYGNHHGVTVAPLPQEESISGIVPYSQSNALYDRILVVLKATQTWVGNSRKANTTPHPFDISLKKNKDKGKGWLRKFLPRKVSGEYTGKQLNPKERHVLFFWYNLLIGSPTNGGSIHGWISQFAHGWGLFKKTNQEVFCFTFRSRI